MMMMMIYQWNSFAPLNRGPSSEKLSIVLWHVRASLMPVTRQ